MVYDECKVDLLRKGCVFDVAKQLIFQGSREYGIVVPQLRHCDKKFEAALEAF